MHFCHVALQYCFSILLAYINHTHYIKGFLSSIAPFSYVTIYQVISIYNTHNIMKERAVNQLDEHFIAMQQRFYVLPKEVFRLGLKYRLAIRIT